MKLKRILAGVTACTIVGSTMLAMPASATTTTKAGDVKIFDVMNAAKTIAQLDVSDDVKSTLLDKFDTNGNGRIDMTELVAMAQRVAELNDKDIVNEYGTADATETTTETTVATTETTVDTTETTEGTTTTEDTTVSTDVTTTTEATTTTEDTTETTETTEVTTTTEETTTTTAALEPTVVIGDNEYEDGDTVVLGDGEVASVSVSDENYDVEVSLAGSKDKDGNEAVRVNGKSFICDADNGKLTITVTVPDTDLKKVITLNVKKVKTIESEKTNLVIGFNSGNGSVYTDEYKAFSEEIQKDYLNNGALIDPEKADEYWTKVEGKADQFAQTKDCKEETAAEGITVSVGGTATIAGFFDATETDDDGNFVKYDTTDTVTYMSTDSNSVDVDANGTITGIKETTSPVQVLVIVGGKSVTSFNVTVIKGDATTTVEADNVYASKSSKNPEEEVYADYVVEGKYVTNVSAGSVPSLNSLKDAVGEENIKSVTFKNADGSAVTDLNNNNVSGWNIIYFVNSTTGTVYYAITSQDGFGYILTNTNTNARVMVLDMEQAKATAVIPTGALTVEINGVGKTAEKTNEKVDAGTVYLTEGTTLNYSDIAKVQGVSKPEIKVTNNQNKKDSQNVSFDNFYKTLTVKELTAENSGSNNAETITFSYEVSDNDTREVSFNVVTVKPALKANPYGHGEADVNDSTVFVAIDEDGKITLPTDVTPVYAINVDKKDGSTDLTDAIDPSTGKFKYKVTSSDEKKVTVDKTGNITVADKYEPKAGDTVTLTYTFEQGQTVSYTIEVVDAMPTVTQSGTANDSFDYGVSNNNPNKNGQEIAFNGLVVPSNLPSGATLAIEVDKNNTTANVSYTENGKTVAGGLGENASGITRVNANSMTLEQNKVTGNYNLVGIEVGTCANVASDTQITFNVKVLDASGNVIATTKTPITVKIKGEAAPVKGTQQVTTPEITLADTAAKTWAGTGIDFELTVTNADGWTAGAATVYSDEAGTTELVGATATVDLEGNKVTLSNVANPGENLTGEAYVKFTLTKDNDTKDVTLKLTYTGIQE